MAGLVPAIHVLRCCRAVKTWMPVIKPGMTKYGACALRFFVFTCQTAKAARARLAGFAQGKCDRPVSLRRRVRRRPVGRSAAPGERTEGARDARGPRGPAGLDASRHRGLSKSLSPRPHPGLGKRQRQSRKSAKPRASRARCLIGLLRTVPGGRPFVTQSRRTYGVTLHR